MQQQGKQLKGVNTKSKNKKRPEQQKREEKTNHQPKKKPRTIKGKGEGKGKGGKSTKRSAPHSHLGARPTHRWTQPPWRSSRIAAQHLRVDRSTAPLPIRKSTVVNLSQMPIDPATHSVLSLGPVFRPTPAPLPDSEVTTAVRKFAKAIRTSAYYADGERKGTYDPRLYHPTGGKVDPDNPALDHTLQQYETTVDSAIRSTARTQHAHSVHPMLARNREKQSTKYTQK